MIIGTRRKLIYENGEKLLPHLTIDGETIQQKNATKYIGVQVDNQNAKIIYLKYHLKLCLQ